MRHAWLAIEPLSIFRGGSLKTSHAFVSCIVRWLINEITSGKKKEQKMINFGDFLELYPFGFWLMWMQSENEREKVLETITIKVGLMQNENEEWKMKNRAKNVSKQMCVRLWFTRCTWCARFIIFFVRFLIACDSVDFETKEIEKRKMVESRTQSKNDDDNDDEDSVHDSIVHFHSATATTTAHNERRASNLGKNKVIDIIVIVKLDHVQCRNCATSNFFRFEWMKDFFYSISLLDQKLFRFRFASHALTHACYFALSFVWTKNLLVFFLSSTIELTCRHRCLVSTVYFHCPKIHRRSHRVVDVRATDASVQTSQIFTCENEHFCLFIYFDVNDFTLKCCGREEIIKNDWKTFFFFVTRSVQRKQTQKIQKRKRCCAIVTGFRAFLFLVIAHFFFVFADFVSCDLDFCCCWSH